MSIFHFERNFPVAFNERGFSLENCEQFLGCYKQKDDKISYTEDHIPVRKLYFSTKTTEVSKTKKKQYFG